MAPSFISKVIGTDKETEPVFERLKEEEQDGEIVDPEWSQYEHSQRYSQRHPKLCNAACLVLGIVLGVAGLLVSQQTIVRSVDIESIKPSTPNSKYSIENRDFETNERQYQW